MPISTPWGPSQGKYPHCRGINYYSTAQHGGFKVSAKKNEQIPEYMRNENGWYECDCEWAIVAVCFPTAFNEGMRKDAPRALGDSFPELYERHFGIELKPGESHVKDQQQWDQDNKSKMVVTTAFGSWHHAVPDGFVGVVAYRKSDRFSRNYLVPEKEYEGRSRFGFSFDPGDYQEMEEAY